MKIVLFFLLLTTQIVLAQKPYVLLVSFDGFRWDYIKRGLTPSLEKFAKEGVSALSFQPTFPSKTFPNHIAMITGSYPQHHGIVGNTIWDPIHERNYAIWDSVSVREPYWYQGEAFWETAQRQGVKTASYFWPGSEIKLDYRTPSTFEKYNHDIPASKRIKGVQDWLSLPYAERPNFLTLYFEVTDDYGHRYGPDGPGMDTALQKAELILQELFNAVNNTPVADSLNIIIVSDHGMTAISEERIIEVKSLLHGYNYEVKDNGPVVGIYPAAGEETKILEVLKSKALHFEVYAKEKVPAHFHFNQSVYIPPVVMIADIGWMIVKERRKENQNRAYSKGMHGYDNFHTDMHGIFFAKGPAFRSQYQVGTLQNIDLYPLLCRMFSIFPRPNIDGNIDRISFILR